jgi:hypothetical protein
MSAVEKLQRQVQALSHDELAQFRAWFLEYDAEVWDTEIEQDAVAGRLDAHAARALRDLATGDTTPL